MDELRRVVPLCKDGQEEFRSDGSVVAKLQEFWAWSVSDLLSNATRGRLAEFIVAKAVGLRPDAVRDEWSAFDIETPGGMKIEVKSAAYVQSWTQRTLSRISFSIKASRHWDAETNVQAAEATRQADVYVFCLLHHMDKGTVDPLQLAQWSFYVLPVSRIGSYQRSASSITLKSLERLISPVTFGELEKAIRSAADRQ